MSKDPQDVANEWVAEQNIKDGYTPAVVEIMLNTEKVLELSEKILEQTEELLRKIDKVIGEKEQ